MYTAAALARIRKLQGVFSTLALLNLSGNLFPEEANICDKATYDYVVVGGGSAGVVLGARLAEANYSTLIIEAGGNPDLETKYPGLLTYIKGSKMDWNFTTEPDGITGKCHKSDDKSITNHLLPSGKVLGGSGITSFMVYGRGLPSDYEKISKIAKDSSWNWKNMLKYFKKSEKLVAPKVLESKYGKYHSAEGKIGVTKEDRPNCNDYLRLFKQAGERVVVDNIGAGILGYSTALYRILDGIRADGACAYLIPLKNHPHLQITRHSLATKIIFDKNKNAVGVEFVKDGKTITVKARKEVIVTTGPIKSPQLLTLSGIGPKKELKKMNISVISDLPVGKNLQNNVGALLVFQTDRSAAPGPMDVHYYPTKLIVGHSALNKSSSIPEYTTLSHIVDDTDFFLAFCGFTVGLKNKICDKLYSLAKNRQIFMGVVLHPNPKSRGTIELKSTDPCDQPKINTGYFTNRDDLEALVDYIMDYMKIESTSHSKSLGLKFMRGAEKCDKHKFGSRAYWKCYALCMTTTLSNEGGTCSMGSVVDSKLKVIGVNRLRVVDASVIPNTIASHIYSSVVAFAEKAADMILGKK